MAYSPDVLVTALQELMPGYRNTWDTYHPCFDAIVSRGQKRTLKHPWLEFGLVPEGPGSLNDVIDGDEFLKGGRRQSAVRGKAYASTLIYVYDVPGQDLREANGEADVVELIRKYPERALLDFQDIIARQLVMGNGPGASSFFTLNGDATYNPKGLTAQNGMMAFTDAASQTGNVFEVTRNSILGWHNQYGHITSMGANGLKTMRKAYWDASQQMAQAEGDVDLMFADRDTYDNYIDELNDFVQFVNREKDTKEGDPAPSKLREGVRFQNATMYAEPYIVRSKFVTPNAQQGVCYGLHSASLHVFTQGSDAKMETGGDFAHRGPVRLPNQDMWRYEYVLSMGLYSDNLRCNFAVTGGAQP